MPLHKIFSLLRRTDTLEAGQRGQAGGSAHRAGTKARALPELDRMEVQAAIVLHLEWCMLFNEHLGVDPDDLNAPAPANLPDAEHSGLGQWILRINQGPNRRHPLIEELARENQRFHRMAQQALDFARSQRMDLASSLLNMEFERSRSRVLEILRLLQKG